jgi:hypothetical protein
VAKLIAHVEGGLKNIDVAVLAATGPVGRIAATILSEQGAKVKVTSRLREKAEALASELRGHKGSIEGFKAQTQNEFGAVIRECRAVISAGAAGAFILNKKTLATHGRDCRVLADINTVPPYGIEGLHPEANGDEIIPGVKAVGGLTIGALKLKVEKRLIKRLMAAEKGVIDYREGFKVAREIIHV